MLVIDASVAVDLCLSPNGFTVLEEQELIAPPLIYAESLSSLREMHWRGEVDEEMLSLARERHRQMPVRLEQPATLGDEAWRVADELGWAKTYDALYVALALICGCQLLTVDMRLRRGADRLGCVITPQELADGPQQTGGRPPTGGAG